MSATVQPTLPPHSDPVLVEIIARQKQQLDLQAKQMQSVASELHVSV
ncbi:MAG: hypothetical protein ABR991_07885 [Terracidiphilus sp.]